MTPLQQAARAVEIARELSEAGAAVAFSLHTSPYLTRAEIDGLDGDEVVNRSSGKSPDRDRFWSAKTIWSGRASYVTVYTEEPPAEGWPKLKPGGSTTRKTRKVSA